MRHRSEVLLGAAAVVLLSIAVVGFLGSAVSARFDNRRWNLPSRIYSDLTVLEPGGPGSEDLLVAKLDRLFYQAVPDAPETPGHYRRSGDSVDVFTRDFFYPGREFHGFRARIEFAGATVRSVTDDRGNPLPALVVEPERLGSVFGEEYEDRTPVRLAEAPRSLVDAILVTEDRDFYRHSGVSIKRTFGAVFATLRGGAVQGGSTLTQQLVKNLYLTPERTIRRKMAEAVIAVVLDARYSKEEILEAYLNEIYLGQHGSISIKGVGEAARFYFGKQVADLDLADSATIAGMIKAPNVYSPFRSADRTRERRNLVLAQMLEQRRITKADMEAAAASPLVPRSRRTPKIPAPHFVDFVKAQLTESYGAKLRTEGFQIFTTLDVDLQQAGQRAVTESLAALEKRYRRLAVAARHAPLQGSSHPARAPDRLGQGARGRPGLPALAVQPGHAGPPPAGLALQAVRHAGGVCPARPRAPDHAGHDPLGLPDHRRVGEAPRFRTMDAPQLRRGLPRPHLGPARGRALDQHPDGARRARGRPRHGSRGVAGRRDHVADAALPVGRARRIRDLAHGDRGGLRGARQRRRADRTERHRRSADLGRPDPRPPGDAAQTGAPGGRGLPGRLDSARRGRSSACGRWCRRAWMRRCSRNGRPLHRRP